ncbi:hypothetical protein IRJ41_018276 [Triplophysa rosa]|uniref:Uncharacterized protein n=1 Tax=Triplophysa rosa TaxID=992332 RepID=A0A9W7TQR0_TRIRA|nr:hypothetical protein IRJ41_018276 [Triplophysa rosa]
MGIGPSGKCIKKPTAYKLVYNLIFSKSQCVGMGLTGGASTPGSSPNGRLIDPILGPRHCGPDPRGLISLENNSRKGHGKDKVHSNLSAEWHRSECVVQNRCERSLVLYNPLVHIWSLLRQEPAALLSERKFLRGKDYAQFPRSPPPPPTLHEVCRKSTVNSNLLLGNMALQTGLYSLHFCAISLHFTFSLSKSCGEEKANPIGGRTGRNITAAQCRSRFSA